MFWSDIIRNYPELVQTLPSDIVALDWNYEDDDSFEKATPDLKKAPCRLFQEPQGGHDNRSVEIRCADVSGCGLGYTNQRAVDNLLLTFDRCRHETRWKPRLFCYNWAHERFEDTA